MTPRRWAVVWVLLLLFTGLLALAISDDLKGPLLGNLLLLYGFAACAHWTEAAFRKWRQREATPDVPPLGRVEWPAARDGQAHASLAEDRE